jgi:hypothetical protein
MVPTFPQEEKWVLNTSLRICMLRFVVPEQWPNKPFPSFLSQISRDRNIPTLSMNLASRSINTSSTDIRLDCSFWRYFGGYETMKYVLAAIRLHKLYHDHAEICTDEIRTRGRKLVSTGDHLRTVKFLGLCTIRYLP